MPDPLQIKIGEPQEVEIIAYRGDTGGFRIAVFEPAPVEEDPPVPYDISAATWDCDIRETKNSTTVIGAFEVTPVVGEAHMVDIYLPVEVARLLLKKQFYDIEMTLNGGVTTLVWGPLLAGEDISRP